MIRNENGLLNILSRLLQESPEPRTCVQLFDMPEVRENAATANRVSDYLGNLWRKGLVERLPAPREDNSSARWMYQWKKQTTPRPVAGEPISFTPNKLLFKKPSIEITEDGNEIMIDLPQLTITIRMK